MNGQEQVIDQLRSEKASLEEDIAGLRNMLKELNEDLLNHTMESEQLKRKIKLAEAMAASLRKMPKGFLSPVVQKALDMWTYQGA